VLQRGPPRSSTLDLRAAGAEVGRALRLARTRAITSNRVVVFRLDVPGHRFAIDADPPRALPAGFALGIVAAAPGGRAGGGGGDVMPGISFAPDGSASGGRIRMAQGAASIEVDVAWLTGRVSVGPGKEGGSRADAR